MLSALTQYINDKYGSKRGLLAASKYKALFLLGFYRSYQQVDFNAVSRLVFVCSGNICRSAFGEYIAKAKGLEAVSYGLHCRGGDNADPRAIAEASLRGVDMHEHVTRNISEYKPQKGDLLLVMEPQHLLELTKAPREHAQVTIVPLWSQKPTAYLNDPFNANAVFFSQCESVVEQCVNQLYDKLNTY
jgi:protein-tyrosine phosphatase